MYGPHLLHLVIIFAVSVLTLLLILRALPDNQKTLSRIKKASGKFSTSHNLVPSKTKSKPIDSINLNQKSEFIFKQMSADTSAIHLKIRRSGLKISVLELFLIYVLSALFFSTIITVTAQSLNDKISFLYTVPAGVVFGFLVIRFWLSWITNRRIDQFNNNFPDAIELMVRCLRTGLPITEMFKQAGDNAAPPVNTEFQRIYNDIKFGIPITDAIWRAAERMPTQEFLFFAISVSIQAETGGNLAENLENLGKILRNRLQIKRLIKTKSAEARLTARIFAFLPVAFVTGLYFLSPSYIEVFINDPRGHTAGIVIVCTMLFGAFLTNRMAKFGY